LPQGRLHLVPRTGAAGVELPDELLHPAPVIECQFRRSHRGPCCVRHHALELDLGQEPPLVSQRHPLPSRRLADDAQVGNPPRGQVPGAFRGRAFLFDRAGHHDAPPGPRTDDRGSRCKRGQRSLGVHCAATVEAAIALGDPGETGHGVDVSEEDDLAHRSLDGGFQHTHGVACGITMGREAVCAEPGDQVTHRGHLLARGRPDRQQLAQQRQAIHRAFFDR